MLFYMYIPFPTASISLIIAFLSPPSLLLSIYNITIYFYSYTCVNTYTGPPSKPEGPLDVSDVTANGCKLKWDKPEDDGGLPVDHYEVSM